MPTTPPPAPGDGAHQALFPSAEEVAFALELARLDSVGCDPWESDDVACDVVDPVSDVEVLASVSASACASDLWLLDSIDPLGLGDKAAVKASTRSAMRR